MAVKKWGEKHCEGAKGGKQIEAPDGRIITYQISHRLLTWGDQRVMVLAARNFL